MNIPLNKILLFALAILLASCGGSGGIGPRGSPIWFETATKAEIQKYKSEVHREREVSGGLVGAFLNRKGSIGADKNFENCLKNSTWRCDKSLLTKAQQIELEESQQDQPYISGTCAENGSCYGDISSITGRPKTIKVDGYYRSDGTYVRGHYRSR